MNSVAFTPGLVSVSFRQHSPAQIIDAAARAGLCCIEWGSDVHLPPGATATAHQIRRTMQDAGLFASSFGSYFRIGVDAADAFPAVLETAGEIDAPIIRVWGYDRPLSQVDDGTLEKLIRDATDIAEQAETAGVKVCLECHPGTLTEEYRDAVRFVESVGMDSFGMYWQPNQHKDTAYNLAAATALAPMTACIHAFHWIGEGHYPLADGAEIWRDYLAIFKNAGCEIPVLLEFMPDGKLETLEREATTLLSLLG